MKLPETDFDREREWWNAKASNEESDLADEHINRALRWREIERHLPTTKTILEIGGATGAFSIPLAERGYEVTHFDISPEMLTIARQKARDISNIKFVEGIASDLSQFSDRTFDLVLNMDGAISFSGAKAKIAIQETCRVSRAKVILTVSHQARMSAAWVQASLSKTGQLTPAVYAMLDRGEWHQEQFADNRVLSEGLTQNYFGPLKAFLPGQLADILENADMQVLRCGGLGSLAGLCAQETLAQVSNDPGLLEAFLSACERFDIDLLPSGPGTRLRAGLIAVACRRN
jgi:SAM-dependent methyltransferase